MSCQQIKVKLACIPGVMNTIFLAIIFNHYVDFSKKGKKTKQKKRKQLVWARLKSIESSVITTVPYTILNVKPVVFLFCLCVHTSSTWITTPFQTKDLRYYQNCSRTTIIINDCI